MRRPKNQARAQGRAMTTDIIGFPVETTTPPPMDDNFDPIAPKAANAILPSERKKTEVVIKKSRAGREPTVRPSPKGSAQSATGSKASTSPDVAPTAPEPKAATPVAKKPKAQSKAKPATPKPWEAPEGAITLWSGDETNKPIGYIQRQGTIYEAFTVAGQRLAMGITEERTEKNFRKKYADSPR